MNERDIFTTAREISDPVARAAYLAKACGDNIAMRNRVERLLHAAEVPDSLLDQPAVARLDADPIDNQSSLSNIDSDDDDDDADDTLDFLEPPNRPDSIGRLGHYEVLEILGKGGFGIVFRAFDEMLHRIVAVKVLAPEMAATSPARKRFLREAQSSAQVRHDNVVQVHAVEEKPTPYLVMEFVAGETLQQRIDRVGPLEVREVVRIGKQIAEGLAAAHATGLIHRDIKPANVLIERGLQGNVKLTDFGLARAVDDAGLTQSGMVAGTPMYMSPEQARGERLDHRTDLFSLGSVLYVMTTGRPPFRGEHPLAVLRLVNEEHPQPIRDIIPETPKWLCEIITRLHAKNPQERFQSAREVAELLAKCWKKLQQGSSTFELDLPRLTRTEPTPIASETHTHPTVPRRFRGSRRWTIAAIVLLFVAGLGMTEVTGVTQLRGTVIRLFTSEGTLVLETDDPEVKITVDGEELIITGAGVKELRVKPGPYKVQGTKDGKVVYERLVTVTKNGKEVVRVNREIPPVAKLEPKKEQPPLEKVEPKKELPQPKIPVDVPKPMPELSSDPDRRAALWLKSLGKVRMEVLEENSIQTRLIFTDQPLPTVPFRIAHVNFEGEPFLELGSGLVEKMKVYFPGVQLRGFHMSLPVNTTELIKILELPAFREVTFVNISSMEADDGIFVQLAKLPKLWNLDSGPLPKITCKGIGALKNCPTLDSITLLGSAPSPEGLAELGQLPALRYLNLTLSTLTAQHTEALSKLKIDHLIAGSCGVNDTMLSSLAKMENLTKLSLPANPITDNGLTELKNAKGLIELNLGVTQVTEKGVADLQKALPNCKITWK